MSFKSLLCISIKNACMPPLALPGWDVTVVTGLDQAARALREHSFCVGLIGDHDRASVKQLDQFLSAQARIRWVGLFRRDALSVPEFRNLVTDHFHDYHTLPVDTERLAHTLGHAWGLTQLRTERRSAEAADHSAMHSLTGKSAAIRALRSQIGKIARITAPVLICGESGSGKELAASAIHALSERRNGPFIAVNCGAMPASLIQAELFGYEQGAFTGANKAKAGLIEAAEGGTIFFDEIAELPLDQQANLLRFLQEGTIYRIGSTKSVKINARVVAASHVNLQTAAAAGRFREDLFYRLHVLPIHVPPLRERQADLPDLAEFFFRAYAADKNPALQGFSHSAMEAIIAHNWPGNVRELINRVRRAMVLGEGRLITAYDLELGQPSAGAPGQASDLGKTRVHAERQAICVKLEEARYNVSRAARELGVSRMTLYRLMAKYQIGPAG